MATPAPDDSGIDWSLATWEGARGEQMRRWAQSSLEEVILAIQEMEEVARRLNM